MCCDMDGVAIMRATGTLFALAIVLVGLVCGRLAVGRLFVWLIAAFFN